MMVHSRAVVATVALLIIAFLFSSADIIPSSNPSTNTNAPTFDVRATAPNSPHQLDTTPAGRNLTNRTSHTRYTRRFSRPHKLMDVAKPKNANAEKKLVPTSSTTTEETATNPYPSLWPHEAAQGDIPVENDIEAARAGLAGGADPQSEGVEVNAPETTGDDLGANTKTNNGIDINNHSESPDSSTDAVNTTTNTSTSHTTPTTHDTNHSTYLDTHSITITAQHYAQYIKPYIAWLIQYASDTYESKLEQQKVVKIKRAVGIAPVKRRTAGMFSRVLRRSNITTPNILHTSSSTTDMDNDTDVHTRTNPTNTNDTTDTAGITLDKQTQQHLHSLKTELTHKRTLSQLQHTINTLHSVVSTKDASIGELIQRLAALEQELYAMRTNTSTSNSGSHSYDTNSNGTVGSSCSDANTNTNAATCSVSDTGSISDCDVIASIAETHISTYYTTTTTTNTDCTDTYDMLHSVLKTLHRLSILMDDAAAVNADLLSAIPADSKFTTTDSTTHYDTIHNPVTTNTTKATDHANVTTSLVFAPLVVRSVYPSIVDAVIQERKHEELRVQRMYDAAAVTSLLLQSLLSACLSDSGSTDSDDSDGIGVGGGNATTECGDTSTTGDGTNTLLEQSLTQVEALTNRTLALENELRLASLQLCQVRGQHYNSHTTHNTSYETNKKGWFDWF